MIDLFKIVRELSHLKNRSQKELAKKLFTKPLNAHSKYF